jgi:hypothetical protein
MSSIVNIFHTGLGGCRVLKERQNMQKNAFREVNIYRGRFSVDGKATRSRSAL